MGDTWVTTLLDDVCARAASDLLMSVGSPPMVRIDGKLEPAEGDTLDPSTVERFIRAVAGGTAVERLNTELELDFAFQWQDRARFRGNAFRASGQPALTLRRLPPVPYTIEQLGIPAVVVQLLDNSRGLILVTGPTGSGKSTTQAALIDHINRTRPCHVVTIEDPIEYVHTSNVALVTQREVGRDTMSFPRALRSALREDPDVLLVGEMRDLESIQSVLTLAETGHLVLATLHTNDAATAVDRIIDAFDSDRHAQVHLQLAGCLVGVVAQRLVPRHGGGQAAAFEVMTATGAVRNLIRQGRTAQLRNVIATSARDGMQTLEASLSELLRYGVIDRDTALSVAAVPDEVGMTA